MTFYFAWVGGEPTAPFSLTTVGDVWGGSINLLGSTWSGSLETVGDIFTTGIWEQDGRNIQNLERVDGLVPGQHYIIGGAGISTSQDGYSSDTSFAFDGATGGSLSPPAQAAEALSIVIKSPINRSTLIPEGSNIVRVNSGQLNSAALLVGRTYGIQGSGIPANTFFTYEGGLVIVMTNPATATAKNVDLTISFDAEQNIIRNLSNATGLEVGQTYRIFGKGVPGTALGMFQDDGTILLSQAATLTTLQTPLQIYRGPVYPDGGPFIESEHARIDESVLSVEIEHSEGDVPSLTIELKNPNIAFLAPGRNVWCWLSWRDSDNIVHPLFHGRLVGVPANIESEKVTLKFIARPYDYENQQYIISAELRDAPFYDPIWLSNGLDTPSTILEARTALWHVDRTTLDVSVSDIVIGEDGTLDIGEEDHLYNETNIQYSNPPLSGVYITATVTWDQEGDGEIDITQELVNAFSDAGSPYSYPTVATYCGDGLFSSWPKPGASIGGGWSVGLATTIVKQPNPIATNRLIVSQFPSIDNTDLGWKTPTSITAINNPWNSWNLTFPIDLFRISFVLSYQARRSRTETVSFFLEADTQSLVTDDLSSVESFSLNSSLIDQPIDPDGSIPMADKRSNSYFKTDRGQQSVQFLLSYARAKLISRARAVTVTVAVPWSKAIGLSCRWNAHIIDRRFPGGEARGKVVSYKLRASASDGMKATVAIGCTIGRGGSVAASPGAGSYADDNYMDEGYHAVVGGTVDIGDGSISYENFDDFLIDDDGVNLFNMTPRRVIQSLRVIAGMDQQLLAIGAARGLNAPTLLQAFQSPALKQPPDPAGALKNNYTRVDLQLVPVSGGGFISEFPVLVSKLKIPKTIDLEAG